MYSANPFEERRLIQGRGGGGGVGGVSRNLIGQNPAIFK